MRRLALAFVACFCFLFAQAAFLKDVPMTLTQPDGTILRCLASGDEFFNYLHDANGYTIIQHPVTGYYVYADKKDGKLVATDFVAGKYDPANKHLAPYNLISPEEWRAKRKAWEVPDTHPANRDFIPNHGTLNNISIFIRFSDDGEFTNTFSSINNMFNNETEGAVSMINYFRSASYGAIEIPSHFYPRNNGETIISYKDTYPRNYFQPYNASTNPNGYNGNDERRLREFGLLQRAVEYVNRNSPIPANLDIDYDNDGFVDNVCFIVKGDVGAWSSLLWPHNWRLYDRNVTINGKRVYKYTLHLADAANYFNTSTLCHEMNHTLGAPDLYHYDDLTLEPIAEWDLMAINSTPPQHMGAYMKMKYGHWIDEIPEITQAGTYTLNPISSPTPENVAYKIATEDPTQYYVLEYRNTSTPFESGLPGSGLLIYRIDTRFEGNSDYNPSEDIYDEIYIFRTNGSLSSNGNSSTAFFSSSSRRTEFSPSTNPYPFFSDGTLDNNIRIYDITSAGSTISFKYGTVALCNPPTDFDVTSNERNAMLTWDDAYNAQSYNVYRNDNLIANISTTNYTDAYLSYGTHEYFIKSVDVQGRLSTATESELAVICPISSNLSATMENDNVVLTWDEPEWVYPEFPLNTLTYGTQSAGNSYLTWENGGVYWGHRHLAEDISSFDGMKLYSIDFYANNSGKYQLLVFKGSTISEGDTFPSEQVLCQTLTVSSSGWHSIDLNEPLIIDSEQDLWLFMHDYECIPNLIVNICNASGTNGCYYSTDLSENIYHDYNNYAFLFKAHLTDGTYTYNLYDNGTLLNEGSPITDKSYTTRNVTGNTIHHYTVSVNYSGGESTPSNKASLVIGTHTLGNLNLGNNDRMTITENSTLTVTGTLSCTNSDHLIIENGAQLINNSNGVKATVKKNIAPYTASRGGWHLIASPITENITQSSGNGLFSNTYDIYSYDQSEELQWRNIKAQSFALKNKGGYLYANSDNPTISFSGTIVGYTSSTPLSYNANVTGKGFNLIGNPYPCNANVNRSFYILNADGSDFIIGSNPVPPCAAILVQAQGANQRVTFSKASSKSSPSITLSIMHAEDNTVLDKVRINLDSDESLEKYTIRESCTKLFIPQNGQDFAVASANGVNEMPISFKAAQDGTHVLSLEVENAEIGYLHLIDNLTGKDIDLLTTPSYTFEANTSDPAERFRITIE